MARQRLVENVLVPHRLLEKLDVSLDEAVVDGQRYKALAVYRFPFTRPGRENLNGRVYPRALWDRVFSRSPVTLSLVDHPGEGEGAGDPARVWAVLRNPGYSADGSLGMVDCYIIDNELGRTALGVLQAGGDVGLSSSGYGDFEADGKTVSPESFELERYFDWVLEPSYSVFGRIDDMKSGMDESSSAVKSNPAAGRGHSEGSELKCMTLRERREFEASLRRIYDDIKSRPLKERLDRAREALTFYEGTDVDACKEDFAALVKEAEKEFEDTLAKGERADDIKREADEFSAQADEARRKQKEFEAEVERLRKENAALARQVEEGRREMEESDDIMRSLTDVARRSVPFSEYEKLRDYAMNAARLYQEARDERNRLQIKVGELEEWKSRAIGASRARKDRDEARRAEHDAMAERRHDAALARAVAMDEERERRRMEGASPEALDYYNMLRRMGERVEPFRDEILSKRTRMEAQMCWLRHKSEMDERARVMRDRAARAAGPSKPAARDDGWHELALPKGFI